MAPKKSMWVLLSVFIIAAWLLGFAAQTGAETLKWRINSYVAHFEPIPVGDTEGHFLATFTRRGLAHFETGEVAVFTNWGTIDAIKGKGTFQGYALYVFEDGSSFVGKFQGSLDPTPKGLSLYDGTGELVKGAGRFEGIKGSLTFTGKSRTTFSKETKGDAYYDVTATYTLSSK